MTDEAPATEEAAPVSRDETHSSIDPQTGALTAEAIAARADIRGQVMEAHPGHADIWHEILATWHKMCGEGDEDPNIEPVADGAPAVTEGPGAYDQSGA
jgi:hypothetical protein